MHMSTSDREPMADQSNNYRKETNELLLRLLIGEWAEGDLEGTGVTSKLLITAQPTPTWWTTQKAAGLRGSSAHLPSLLVWTSLVLSQQPACS